jgi:signal transduction histidine kinase/ligand-binding sensor domain-containing protein
MTAKNAAKRAMNEADREAPVLAKMAAIAISTLTLVLGSAPLLALDPSLDISQYGHAAWTAPNGFSVGAIFAMAQTPDGYLWLGGEFGLFRFDGVQAVPWQPPAGQKLPDKPYALLVTRDGTLWIGTFRGLVSWKGDKLTRYPEIGDRFVTSLLEDREGTVWVGLMGQASDAPTGELCAIRSGHAQCDLRGGAFGEFVWSLFEDSSGTLWAGAESGVWRWKPGSPRRYETPGMRIGDLTRTDDGNVLIGVSGGGLLQLAGDRLESYPIRDATNRDRLLPDRIVDSNKLLRDRDGGLWIGTRQRGLVHIHNGRTDVFTKADGLSGDISCSLFEDREGNIWVATTGGLDRFRELPVTTLSAKQGLSSDATLSVLAATDESIWVAAQNGLTRWKNGKATVFDTGSGLPHDRTQSLFQDDRGRIWVFTDGGLAYLTNDDRFVGVPGVPSNEVFYMTGDRAGGLWLSTHKSLLHMRDGRLVEDFDWPLMGRHQQATAVVPDQSGVWLAFWSGGGVLYFADGKVRSSYTPANGLGEGPVEALQLDRDGAVWAATQEGGLSRIKDGRVATLTTRNGLPCDTIHWSMEDDDRSLWLYAACGLVRITRTELDAWIADPKRRIETTVWDAADGVRLNAVKASSYSPTLAKSTDGRLWFLSKEGVQVIDPGHLLVNRVPPPVHIEKVFADGRLYWQQLPGETVSTVHLPPLTRELQVDYVGLSFVAPEKMQFRIKLEGQDEDWRVPVNPRHSRYTNLKPGKYTLRVKASNNSGVWNEQGDTLELWVAPAYYQTNWFRALCVAAFMALLWAAHQVRVRQVRHQFEITLEARVGERTRIGRELHDTLLQSFHGVLLRFQTASYLLPARPAEAKEKLDGAIEHAAKAITEGRDAVQGLRASTLERTDLAVAIRTLGDELATDASADQPPTFSVAVEGQTRDLHPMVRDEVYKIAAEALRNALRHAHAGRVEVEIRYDNEQFRLRVRDDGKGIDPVVLANQGLEGHYGLRGMPERAALIGGKLAVWSEAGVGTEVELHLPARIVYATPPRRTWWSRLFAPKPPANVRRDAS